MAKAKATKGDSKGQPIETMGDTKARDLSQNNKPDLLSVELPKLDTRTAEAVCAEVLRGHYCESVRDYQRDVEKLDKDRKESAEKLLEAFEILITWLDQDDAWLKSLFEQPKDN